jgi:hydroxypyruvate isomerase
MTEGSTIAVAPLAEIGSTDHRFTVNLSILFTELPLLERPAAAAAAGFTAVELWWPWTASPVPEPSALDALRSALTAAGTRLTGLNFYAGRLPGPDRGALSVPGEESARFRANVDVAADFAGSLCCTALNALYGNRGRGTSAAAQDTYGNRVRGTSAAAQDTYGNRVDGTSAAEQDALARENLALAARAADRIGAVLLIEALNAAESPQYPLVSAPSAVEVVHAVNEATGLDNARFLMDLYHLSRNGEDLHRIIDTYTPVTGHVQIADDPGRGAPGTGGLDFADLLGRLTKAGYEGWVGLEYKPGDRPSASAFDWLAPHSLVPRSGEASA